MKLLLSISALSIFIFWLARPSLAQTARPARKSLTSLSETLIDPKRGASLTAMLGHECATVIKKVYRSGKTFEIGAMTSKIKLLKDAPADSEGSHFEFYHYTSQDVTVKTLHPEIRDRQLAQRQIISEGGYDQLLRAIRERQTDINSVGLCVSSETQTAKVHGPRLVAFMFTQEAKVFDNNDLDFKQMLAEIEQKAPGITTTCKEQGLGGLYYLALEDSGVDLVDFHGDPSGGHRWFQIMSFKSVIQSRVLN